MKKIISAFFISALFILIPTAIFAQQEDCNGRELKKTAMEKLPPYYYSSAKITNLNGGNSEEIEIPLLKGEKYKLLFNISELGNGINVEIYDGPKEDGKRDLVFSSKDMGGDIISFEPKKSKTLYLNYQSTTENPEDSGCVAVIIGYQLNF